MLHLSKKMVFAIEAVLDIAYHAGGDPVQSRDITRRQNIPRRYLEQTLQHLVRSGVLVGVRGPHGGYRLARERRRMTIGDIVRVVQAMENDEDMYKDLPGSPLAVDVVRPMWMELRDMLMNRLDDITIDDLCRKAWKAGLACEAQEKMDFSI